MKWEKLRLGDRWVLLSEPSADGVHKALGAVERVGLAFEARDSAGIMIGKRSLCKHAMQLVEKAEAHG